MSGHINSSSSWKNLKSAHCKVGGQWKEIKSGYAKDNGTWKAIFSSSKVYSIIYDKSLATDPTGCLTYTGACKGFTPMLVNSNTGYVNEGSWAEGNGTLFDSFKVGTLYNKQFTEMSKSSVTASNTERDSYSYTRIPKIYQKVTKISDTKVQLDLSLDMFEGATIHPAFIADGKEFNYKYIARFFSCYGNSSNSLGSFSGQFPLSAKMNYFISKGIGWNFSRMLSYWDWDLINKLYLLAFKSFSRTRLISPSMTGTSETGSSNGHPWMWGGSEGSAYMFLGIEAWGVAMLDNTYVSGKEILVGESTNPVPENLHKLCDYPISTNSNGVYPLTCRAGLNDFFMAETAGGSETSGLCANQIFIDVVYSSYLRAHDFFGLTATHEHNPYNKIEGYTRYVKWSNS